MLGNEAFFGEHFFHATKTLSKDASVLSKQLELIRNIHKHKKKLKKLYMSEGSYEVFER